MAPGDKKVPRKTATAKTAPADDFNNVAEIGPRVNRAQLIKEVKTILAQRIDGHNFKTVDGEELTPTPNHKIYMEALSKHALVLVDGPAGTGKTIWAAYMALVGFTEKKYNSILITAPAVEAGEKLGYLPGPKDDKMLPYINQILKSIDEWIGKDLRVKLLESEVIEIVPYAHMRGMTYKKTFCILDESQNASGPNLMTAITRIGKGTTLLFMGSDEQNDRTKGTSAFVAFFNRFTHPDYLDSGLVGYARMNKSDALRSELLQMIIERNDHLPLHCFESHSTNQTTHVAPRILPAASNGKEHDVHGFPIARPC